MEDYCYINDAMEWADNSYTVDDYRVCAVGKNA